MLVRLPRSLMSGRAVLLLSLALLLHGQRGGEVFVEGEEVFYALAVAGEGVFAVAAVHGAVEGLVGFGEVLACGFLLYEQAAGPEDVDFTPGAGKFFHGFLEGGDGAAFDAEDAENTVPKRLAAAAF